MALLTILTSVSVVTTAGDAAYLAVTPCVVSTAITASSHLATTIVSGFGRAPTSPPSRLSR